MAQHPAYKDAVYANQYLPSYVGCTAKLDTLKTKGNLSITFDDPPTMNSYLVRIYSKFTIPDGSQSFSPQFFSSYDASVDLLYHDDFDIDVQSEKYSEVAIVSDKDFNGKTKTLELNLNYYQGEDFEIEFINMNPDMDRFYRSYYKYKDFGEDPFSEPQNIYYNVTNGYGTIAGGTRALVKAEKI